MRLTKKIDLQEFGSVYTISSAFISEIPNIFLDKDYVGEAINKLGQLEDFEEELGCPLEVYLKIQLKLVNTIYVKRYETVRQYWDENGLQLEQKECLQARHITRVGKSIFYYQDILGKESMAFSEYGTEFWLREDKSE